MIIKTSAESSLFNLEMVCLLVPSYGSGILWKLKKSLSQEDKPLNISNVKSNYSSNLTGEI